MEPVCRKTLNNVGKSKLDTGATLAPTPVWGFLLILWRQLAPKVRNLHFWRFQTTTAQNCAPAARDFVFLKIFIFEILKITLAKNASVIGSSDTLLKVG